MRSLITARFSPTCRSVQDDLSGTCRNVIGVVLTVVMTCVVVCAV